MQKLEELLAHVFSVDAKTITNETSPKNLSSWDSFNTFLLVQTLEKEYKIKLDINDIAQVANVSDLKKMLKKYAID